MAEQLYFPSGGARCAAWLTLPAGEGPHPAVVLCHGGGATHEMKLDQYERWFSEAGFAVLAFDYRHFGKSGGEPRQIMSPRKHVADVHAAVAFARSRPEIDGARVALWGTSFGASHAVVAAAADDDIAATVVQCPVLKGSAPAFASGFGTLNRLTGPIISDALRAAFGFRRRYVQIVGHPGDVAFVTVPGAYAGWHSVMPDGYVFDNRVAAAAALEVIRYDASARARDVKCPLLVCVSDHEELISPKVAARVARRAPKGVAKHYPADHFSVYHRPLVERIVADQIAFLSEHLKS
ncbi:MAG: alpha/beta fold hydrolase [Parvibaculum sp.]|uniref:alpha/beta hydrolase n=1 Tax=Parvibaculum sp. TaxID=2024848 RepID=UPI0034A01678